MPSPLIKKQDLLQSRPDDIRLGAKPVYRLNVYVNDGFGQPNQSSTPTINNATCTIYNVTDMDTGLDSPAVTVGNITNGKQLSFEIDTTTTGLDTAGRFIAELEYSFNGEVQIEYIFFNVVERSNPFGSSS